NCFEQHAVIPFLGTEVIGAFAYGSFRTGDHTPASDIDYIMITRTTDHDLTIRQAITQTTQQFFVPLQVQAIDLAAAQRGMHSCDTPFQEHLRRHQQTHGCYGKNPLDILQPVGMNWEQSLRHAAYTYLRSAKKARIHELSEEQTLEQLARTITQVPHIFRIVLQLVHGQGRMHDDTKATIFQRYCELPIDLDTKNKTIRNYRIIREAVATYTELLTERKSTSTPSAELLTRYQASLTLLQNVQDHAFGIIHDNALLLGLSST
ncbi:MAG TPA: nucleotidyltransferase domain-containing protein, partial [Candidatus Nanoarchaeia archaeon]|nr:nucleotidyltransferase domain-containing protein [Candidatus Nanoarchaeia archaeon]